MVIVVLEVWSRFAQQGHQTFEVLLSTQCANRLGEEGPVCVIIPKVVDILQESGGDGSWSNRDWCQLRP